MNSNNLSVIINTKNEAGNIKDCIKSVKNLANEIIVCDMQSTDDTVKIAKSLGAITISIRDYGYVEPARMKAIKKASFPWILIIDADERIGKFLTQEIAKYLESPPHSAVALPRKNIMLGTWIKHGMRWPDYQIRLFKKNRVKFSKEIHSMPIVDGETHKFPPEEKYAIKHDHSSSIEGLLIKTWQQAQKEKFYQDKAKITPEIVRERINHEVDWRFLEHEGFKDGIPGYLSAKFMELYRLLEFASHWEKNKDIEFNENQSKRLVERKENSIPRKLGILKRLLKRK